MILNSWSHSKAQNNTHDLKVLRVHGLKKEDDSRKAQQEKQNQVTKESVLLSQNFLLLKSWLIIILCFKASIVVFDDKTNIVFVRLLTPFSQRISDKIVFP